MTTMKIENAKAAEKVAFFENLKETHDGKIFIDDVLEAWNLATCTLGKLKKNNTKTTNAGYTILENSVGDWVSVLNNCFEVNLTTGQTFNIWTDSDVIRNAKNYAWDEVEEGIFHAKNADEKTFWLNICKAKFVNSLITLGVKDLVAAEIIREEELIACIDDYVVKPKVLTVTESEIKSAVSKYDSVSIPFDDFIIDVAVDEGLPNWEREQAKLERKQEKLDRRHYVAECRAKAKIVSDFFKKIGIPKKALKISIDNDYVVRGGGFKPIDVIYFEPKTEKISEKQLEKIATYFENDYTHTYVDEFIDGYEGHFDVFDEDDPDFEIEILTENTPDETPENTVEENKAEKSVEEIDASEYAVSVEAQEVAVDAEFENAKNEEFNKVPKFDTQTNENPAVKNSETIYLARTGAYTYELENGEGLDDYYFKQKIHAAIKNGAKVKIRNGLTYYGWIDFSPSEMNNVEICDVYRMDELGDRIDNLIAAIIEYPKSAEVEEVKTAIAEPSETEIFQAKIAEIKNRKHKSCIDWDAVYNDFRIEEIFNLQKDFKKFLKLGEMKRAENVFENIKLCFKAA